MLMKFSNLGIKSIIHNITAPIYNKFAFFASNFIIMGAHTLYYNLIAPYFSSEWNVIDYHSLFNTFFAILLYSYICTIILYTVKAKIFNKSLEVLFYIISFFLFATNDFLFKNFGSSINPAYFVLLAETTNKETNEFINQYILSNAILFTLIKTLFLIIVTITINVSLPYIKRKLKHLLHITKVSRVLNLIFVSLVMISLCNTAYIFIQIHKATSDHEITDIKAPLDVISSIYTSFVSLNLIKSNIEDAILLNTHIYKYDNANITYNDSINIILVIGESYIKGHSNLYGYSLNTTPYLNIEKDNDRLVIFNDAMTSANTTSVVIKNMLYCNNSNDNETWNKFPYFLSLFKKAGYNVCLWSNQMSTNNTGVHAYTLNSLLYNDEISNISYSHINETPYKYDGDLVDSFKDSIDTIEDKYNLILFHLMGQHHMAKERYPNELFSHFTADSIKREETYLGQKQKEYIANYDNATLYNDYVLNKIIDIFKNSNSVLVYLSDHGDEVYDYRNQCGRDHSKEFTANKLKHQYDIPFIVWYSDTFKEKNPQVIESIKNAVNRPFCSDNLCHFLLNLGHIETKYYRDSLDIISPNYKNKKRMINSTYSYDDIRFSLN